MGTFEEELDIVDEVAVEIKEEELLVARDDEEPVLLAEVVTGDIEEVVVIVEIVEIEVGPTEVVVVLFGGELNASAPAAIMMIIATTIPAMADRLSARWPLNLIQKAQFQSTRFKYFKEITCRVDLGRYSAS